MLKKFFRKFFFSDDPAAGAVFGSLLLIVSSFCFANLICFDGFLAVLKAGTPQRVTASLALVILIVQIFIALYAAILFLSLFFHLDRTRLKLFFWSILAVDIALFPTLSEMGMTFTGVSLISTVFILIYNAICIRKNNYWWYIALILSYLLLIPAVAVLVDLICSCGAIFFFGTHDPVTLFDAKWRIAAAYSGVIVFIFFTFCSFKLWASASDKRLRDVWGNSCNILLIILFVAYAGFVGAALCQQTKCAGAFAALEENFQREISAAALKNIYYRDNRKSDEKFYSAFNEIWDDFNRDDIDFWNIFSEAPRLNKLSPQLRNKFLDTNAEELGKFFDAPLPARKRDYSDGKIFSIMMPDLSSMRLIARFFSWQIRIACENNDHAKAMQAWIRSGYITDYLKYSTSLIGTLVLAAVELNRLDSLEFMLSSNILSDNELSEIQQYLQKSADLVPQLNRDALYFETVMWHDLLRSMADGTLTEAPSDQPCPEGAKHYRFLLPGLWYMAVCNYNDLMNRFNVKDLSSVDDKINCYSSRTILARLSTPSLKSTGNRIIELQTRYQAFIALIEAEKIKRKTGAYPEKLPLNIIDNFTGKPLCYKVGSHTVRESVLIKFEQPEGAVSAEGSTIEHRTKTVQGVAVWSLGVNGIDDKGIYGNTRSEGDDLRALLRISK
ncbi:MAG: hypothetical protein E7051_00095 [Lentisphaerae bacterium]|nr:hypothetical protein [Lentisphaerota bacterium]